MKNMDTALTAYILAHDLEPMGRPPRVATRDGASVDAPEEARTSDILLGLVFAWIVLLAIIAPVLAQL